MTTSSTHATKLALLACAATLSLLPPLPAFAQGNNEAIAESLFHEGKRLYNEKRYPEACQKLDQSHRADPAGGTVLLLAMCYERQGRTASAWAKYSEALALARRDGRADREQKSQEAMAALEPQLSYVSVSLDSEAKTLTGMELVLDNTPIPLLVDAKVPVDPGDHILLVRAKDCEPWSHNFSITEKGATVGVTVPRLTPRAVETQSPPVASALPAAESAPPPQVNAVTEPPRLEPKSDSTRTIAYVLGGVGLVAAGVGGYFALRANSLNNKANDLCADVNCDSRKAVSYSKDASSQANLATWFVSAGAAAMATAGAVLIFGGNSSTSVETTAIALPSGGAITVTGRY